MKKLFIALMAIAAIAFTSCKPKQYETAQLHFVNESDRYVAIIVQADSETPSLDGATCVAQLHPNQAADANERINIKDLHVFFIAAPEGVEPDEAGDITYKELLGDEALKEYFGYDEVTLSIKSDLATSVKGSTSSSSSFSF